MDFLKKFFPLSFKLANKDGFVKGIVIYALLWLLAPAVVGIVSIVVGFILGLTIILAPVGIVLGFVLGIAGFLASLYGLAGLVILILVYTNVIKLDAPAAEETVEEAPVAEETEKVEE